MCKYLPCRPGFKNQLMYNNTTAQYHIYLSLLMSFLFESRAVSIVVRDDLTTKNAYSRTESLGSFSENDHIAFKFNSSLFSKADRFSVWF